MSPKLTFGGQEADNDEQKCLCVLCLDISGSMSGAPVAALNQALREFQTSLEDDFVAKNRVEVCIITFDSVVECVREPALVEGTTMPTLHVKGSTKLVDGMRAAIRKVEERKQYYRAQHLHYYRPFIVLMTDGGPDKGQDVAGLNTEIQVGIQGKKFNMFAVGSPGADMHVLNQLVEPATSALQMQGLNYRDFFKWLSTSLGEVSRSGSGDKLSLPSPNGWAQITV